MGLLELVIVLVIVGLIAAAALGRITWAAAAIGVVALLLVLVVLAGDVVRLA